MRSPVTEIISRFEGWIALAMSGFAGSKSLDERRRRRLAVDETGSNTATEATDGSKPLPARTPSEKFPLRRIVSRAHWKLSLVLFGVTCLAGAIVAVGHLPAAASGKYGPGLERLASDHAAGLATVCMASLLLVSAQLSWLVRWARSRSLRDFRGRYRAWWWSAAALALSGFAVLTEIPEAVVSTLVWATNWPPVLGSYAAYELAPALLALIVLFPGLQRDMRGCRTSRSFLFLATLALLAAGGATVAGESFASILQRAGGRIAPELAVQSLWLAASVTLFGAFLFHARHVVYESVEPPEVPKRAGKEKIVKSSKPPKTASKAKKTTSTSQGGGRESGAGDRKSTAAAEAKTVSQKETIKPAPQIEPAKPAASPPAPVPSQDDRWAEIGTIEVDGRVIRLDGPEDPMKGLSKRERRKVRKAIKDYQRAGGEEY